MMMTELSNKRRTITHNIDEIDKLEKWFRFEYPAELNKINRYVYLGLPVHKTRYQLETEAYKKENRLRELKGLEPLPEIHIIDLL